MDIETVIKKKSNIECGHDGTCQINIQCSLSPLSYLSIGLFSRNFSFPDKIIKSKLECRLRIGIDAVAFTPSLINIWIDLKVLFRNPIGSSQDVCIWSSVGEFWFDDVCYGNTEAEGSVKYLGLVIDMHPWYLILYQVIKSRVECKEYQLVKSSHWSVQNSYLHHFIC